MADNLSKQIRAGLMSRVKSKNNNLEKQVRSGLHRAGLRYSLHKSDLPGKPDIVLSRHKMVVFVHGCFWHSHHCKRGKRPKSNVEFWSRKLDRNVARDRENVAELLARGWRVAIIWECDWKKGVDEVITETAQGSRA